MMYNWEILVDVASLLNCHLEMCKQLLNLVRMLIHCEKDLFGGANLASNSILKVFLGQNIPWMKMILLGKFHGENDPV